jgi:hypothetical protein
MMLEVMTHRSFDTTSESPTGAVRLSAPENESLPSGQWNGPAVVKKVYLFDPRSEKWPRPDLEARAEIAEIEAGLAEVEQRHPGKIHFTGGELLQRGENIQAWIDSLGDVDAIMPVTLSSGIEPMLAAIGETNIPTLLFALPYSGPAWAYMTGWSRAGKKGDVLATSDYAELDRYVRIFRTIHHLRKSRVLVVAPPDSQRRERAEAFRQQFGSSFEFLSYEELRHAYETADPRKAEHLGDSFSRNALRVVEPTRSDVHDAMRAYLGLRNLLERKNANALSVDCHSSDRSCDLPAYPCLAFSMLNDQGMYGVCEGDLAATMTQMLVTSYSGKPGFVSDPVFDTGRNEVIHAHCVAPTALQGVGGATCPYILRSHSEDHKGVAIQVLMPIGEPITIAKFVDPQSFLVSTAHVAGNVDGDRGCRTKIVTRVSDARKMLDNYAGGLHRVIFYGDYVADIERMSRLMGFKVVHEL